MLVDSSERAYEAFYERYASKLWGIILLANLPVSPHSETILINTLSKAWQQQDKDKLSGNGVLAHLVNLAYGEGLPRERIEADLRASLR